MRKMAAAHSMKSSFFPSSFCGFLRNGDLFPTRMSALIFVAYMALFINQGILITSTKNTDNSYNYNTTTVVLLTECLKLIISCFAYVREHNLRDLVTAISQNVKVFALYFVPALLYCLYNNLAFVNLSAFDPTTYFLLLQFRVVVTGVVFQFLFKKKLSTRQWLSLLMLTVGCIIKELPTSQPGGIVIPHFTVNIPLILLQVFCSCFAGVYNEYLLKTTGIDVHIMLQNIFMYVDSIVCNLAFLALQGQFFEALTPAALGQVLHVKVLGIIVNSAAIGIVTSFFLHTLNSILKTFASALELMFTAVLCWFIFGIPIDRNTVAAIAVVSLATYIYAQNPVINKAKAATPPLSSDDQKPRDHRSSNPSEV